MFNMMVYMVRYSIQSFIQKCTARLDQWRRDKIIKNPDKTLKRVQSLNPKWGPMPKKLPDRPQYPSSTTLHRIYRKMGHYLLRCDNPDLELNIVRSLRTWYDGIFVEVEIHPKHRQDYEDYCYAKGWKYFKNRKPGEKYQEFYERISQT